MRSSIYLFFGLAVLASAASSSPPVAEPKKDKPCTITSPFSGSFYDLNLISVRAQSSSSQTPSFFESASSSSKGKENELASYKAKGWDYPANFTLNFCAPVVEDVQNVVGVDERLWKNVSAFYEMDNKVYSIGQLSTTPVFRGRKLVLNYTNGSPCPAPTATSRSIIHSFSNSSNTTSSLSKSTGRRKTALISLLCDRDPLSPQVTLSFVGTLDSCSYFFEARTFAACGTSSSPEAALSPGAVFGVILGIAVAVYLLGGVVYQRMVLNQRGWRQCPNYGVWAGMLGFIKDVVLILFATCFQRFPGRGGSYRILGHDGSRVGRRSSDDENRLIDQLDEEWDD